MKRIDHPTVLQDLFGPGKHGFTENIPTVLTEAWFNGVQEELLAIIENTGQTPAQDLPWQFHQVWRGLFKFFATLQHLVGKTSYSVGSNFKYAEGGGSLTAALITEPELVLQGRLIKLTSAELQAMGAKEHVFVASRHTYLMVHPLYDPPKLSFVPVALNAPPPPVPVGWTAVLKTTTNATEVTANESLLLAAVEVRKPWRFWEGVFGMGQEGMPGLYAETADNAETNHSAMHGWGRNKGIAGHFVAQQGHALVVECSTDDRAALHIHPQLGLIDFPEVGDLSTLNDGSYHIYDGQVDRQLWSTPRGMLLASLSKHPAVANKSGDALLQKNLFIPVGQAALVMIRGDLHKTITGENAGVMVKADGKVLYQRSLFLDQDVFHAKPWSWQGYIHGPVNSIAWEASWVQAGKVLAYYAELVVLGLFRSGEVL